MDKTKEQQQQFIKKKERNFPNLQLTTTTTTTNEHQQQNPILIIQSPKTPTLCRKQKAASLDSSEKQQNIIEINRDANSVPNTPKKQQKPSTSSSLHQETNEEKSTLAPLLGGNLKRFASNSSISGSQTLKTLPEIMTLHEFNNNTQRTEPIRIKAKGLLERRGSNASLTIDIGSSTTNLSETKQMPPPQQPIKLNAAKSVSNLTTICYEKCACLRKFNEACTIYESVATSKTAPKFKHDLCKCNLKFLPKCYVDRHCVCNIKFRRKSLSNENLYVPPCNFCHFGSKDCHLNRGCAGGNKGSRKALYPRQNYIEASQLLSEDFKLHLQNVQYLQTAGSVLSIAELRTCCQMDKIPRLHQEFWEIPLNLQEKCMVSGSQSRNRYKGVLPNEHSRVILSGAQPYIHANYIKGADYTETAYIATQGPMSHTCEDFWRMVWTNNVFKIVMLTALVERGRSKCELYFPLGEQGESKNALFSDGVSSNLGLIDSSTSDLFSSFEDEVEVEKTNGQIWGQYQIKYLTKEYLGKCVIRKLELTKNGEIGKRQIHHYWYPNWADHKLASPEQVLKIALHVLELNTSESATDSSGSATSAHHSNSNSSSSSDRGGGAKFKFNFDNIPPNDAAASSAGGDCDFGGYECKKTSSFESSLKDNRLFMEKRMNYAHSKIPPKTTKQPIVAHCSAGIGRTGCFLAILNGINQLKTNFNVDILAIVCSLRLNRGGMVQTAEQYELIHRVLSFYTDML